MCEKGNSPAFMYISPSHLKCKCTCIINIVMSQRTNFSIPGSDTDGIVIPERPANISGTPRGVNKSTRPDHYSYDPDQWYLDAIAQYSNDPDFYNYLLSNPHLIRNSGAYQPQWYETAILGTADTNEARYNAQLKSEANSWLADALASKHIEDYTDPAAEVARRKAAGINDDLSGGSQIGSGEPANPNPQDTDTNLPYAASDAANSEAHGVISSVMSLFTMGINAAQSFQQLNAGEISLLNGEIENFSNFTDLVGNALSQNLSPEELQSIVTGKDDNGALSKAVNFLYSDTFQSQLSPRLRRKFSKLVRRGSLNDAYTSSQLQSILKSYVSDRYDLASTMGHPFYKSDFTDMMATIGDYVNKYIIEYDKLWKDFDFDKLGVVDKETGMTLGEMEGQAALAQSKYDALRSQSDEMTESLWNNIIGVLKSKNTWWSNLLLFFVPFARSIAANARLPHVGLTASVRNGVHDVRDTYVHQD